VSRFQELLYAEGVMMSEDSDGFSYTSKENSFDSDLSPSIREIMDRGARLESEAKEAKSNDFDISYNG